MSNVLDAENLIILTTNNNIFRINQIYKAFVRDIDYLKNQLSKYPLEIEFEDYRFVICRSPEVDIY